MDGDSGAGGKGDYETYALDTDKDTPVGQAPGGKDEGERGFDAAKAGIGGFGQQTLSDRDRSYVAENVPTLLTMGVPIVGNVMSAMSRAVGYARSKGYDVQDTVTPDDGGPQGQTGGDATSTAIRARSKELSNDAAAADAATRSSVAAANNLNGSSELNRSGYSSANRRRRSLFDSGAGSQTLGGG